MFCQMSSPIRYNRFLFIHTLKGIRGVRLDNRKVLCAPGPRTKNLERLFCRSINYDNITGK